MTRSYLPHLDGLRAIAVLSVILFHLDVPGFSGGYIGVDVFFVISGFLITGILKAELESTGDLKLALFYKKRVKRLAPALLATLLATTLFSMLVFSPTHFQRIGGALASSLFSVSNFFFWLEADYFDTSAKFKPFLHTWSLSVEEQFYLLWPISILVLYKLGFRVLVMPALITASLFSLGLNFILADGYSSFLSDHFQWLSGLIVDGKSTLFFLLPFRIFEFSIGAMLIWVSTKSLPSKILYDVLAWLGFWVILYSILRFDDSMLFPYWYALAPCIGAALIIYAGGHSYSRLFLTNRLMVGVGLISYSLYLVHWPIIVFCYYLGGDELDLKDQVIAGSLTVILALLLYYGIEKRFRRPGFFRARPTSATLLASVFLALFASGVHSYTTDGWDWRTGEAVVNFDDVGDARMFHKAYYGGSGYPHYGPVGSSATPDIVLMGDSHGRQYAEGFNTVFF